MINFRKLHIKNFFSHRDTHIDFNDYQGLVLIEGVNQDGRYTSNGSGKSTILEALLYALTGNTLRNVGVNEVVNRNAKKDTCVSLEFTTNVGDLYSVSRYRKDTKNGDSLALSRGEEILSKRLNKDTQNLLDSIIGISYDVLVNTMFLGEGLSSRFTQLSDVNKKQLIESTLNLEYDLIKSRERANTQMKALNLEIANLTGRKAVLEDILRTATSPVNISEESLVTLSQSVQESRALLQDFLTQRDTLLNRITVLTRSIAVRESQETRLEYLDTESVKLVHQLSHLEDDLPTCSLCHQVLRDEESLNAVRSQLSEVFRDCAEEMKTIQSQLDNTPPLQVMRERLSEAQNAMVQLRTQEEILQSRLSQEESQLAQGTATLTASQEALRSLENHQVEYGRIQEELKNLVKELSYYEYFYKLYAPTGILTDILQDAIDYINSRIKVYTDILLDKPYQISIEKGKIILGDSSGSTYHSLSNGERKRLDLSIQFSLHDYVYRYCGRGCNILICDEILDALDAVGMSNIIEVLRLKQEYCQLKSIFVITHNNELKPYFDEVITVKKNNQNDSFIL